MKEIDDNQYVQNYMTDIIQKIHKGFFKSKDELLEELKNDEKFSNIAELRDDFYNKILNEYDKYIESTPWINLQKDTEITNNFEILDSNTLNNLYEDDHFIETIQSMNIPANQKQYLIEEISHRKQQNKLSYQNEMRPKVYELKNNRYPNGFLEIILLSMITLLFSLLCVTSIYIQIIGY